MANTRLVFVSLLFALPWCRHGRCEPVTSAPAAAVASGRPLWVDSQPNPKHALINARVDIGSLCQSGEVIEARLAWPLTLGRLKDVSAEHPGVMMLSIIRDVIDSEL
jgi:hypothetical protein